MFHNLFNQSNKTLEWCYVVMEITKYKSVTDQTWNNGFDMNWSKNEK
jgi:hypothetical protein